MDIRKVIGIRLRELRKLKGLNQVKMADLAGVNPKYYSEIERGQRNVTIKILEKIATKLGVTLDELFWFPTDAKLSKKGEEVVALVTTLLKSKDEKSLAKLKIFLTDILDYPNTPDGST